jgi:hypothetical protein
LKNIAVIINAVVTHSEAIKGCLTKAKLNEHTTSKKKPRTSWTEEKERSLSREYNAPRRLFFFFFFLFFQ